jgi:hypothetical protein
MDNKQKKELERIIQYKGSVKDFKSFWDAQAGLNTNTYNTPEYQGYNNVHPTRGANKSPHWKITLEEEVEIGNEDEVGMLMGDVLSIERSITDLKNTLMNLSSLGKVDFPHWWQSKIIKAKDYLLSANEYLQSELNKNGNS